MESGAGRVIAVRGNSANHSNCPGKHATPFVPEPDSSLTINDVSKKEGRNGTTTTFTFTVTRTGDLSEPTAIGFATEDAFDGADAGDDYEAKYGTLDFAIDDSSKTIEVVVYGDSLKEPNETFFVNIFTETAGHVTQGTGTIRNDDRK